MSGWHYIEFDLTNLQHLITLWTNQQLADLEQLLRNHAEFQRLHGAA
jgi:hypothetical protein